MTYDLSTPAVLQTDPWSCSVASTAWALHSIGRPVDYRDLEDTFIARGLANPAYGLLVGSGAYLQAFLENEYGLFVERASDGSAMLWGWLQQRAGRGPILLGGHAWNHWSGVRDGDGTTTLRLANPAPGWEGVGEVMDYGEYQRWGPWAALYIAGGTEEDAVRQEDYDALKAQYDALNSWTSSLLHDTLKPTVDDLVQLAQDIRDPKAARLRAGALAARLRPFVEGQ